MDADRRVLGNDAQLARPHRESGGYVRPGCLHLGHARSLALIKHPRSGDGALAIGNTSWRPRFVRDGTPAWTFRYMVNAGVCQEHRQTPSKPCFMPWRSSTVAFSAASRNRRRSGRVSWWAAAQASSYLATNGIVTAPTANPR